MAPRPPRSAPRVPLATPEEVAAYLRKPTDTLKAWRHRGTGPKYTTVGRGVLYDWADVDAWLKEQPGGGEDVRQGAA